MIKIAERDDDYIYMYSKNPEEIKAIMEMVQVSLVDTYEGCLAILVKKQKRKNNFLRKERE